MDELEFAAYSITLLLKAVNPAIDEETSYELVYEMVHVGLDEVSAPEYGRLIRATGQRVGDTVQ